MNVLFLPSGDRQWAGARLRAWNIAERLPGASCLKWNGSLPRECLDADVLVLQKLYDKYNVGNQRAVLQGVIDARRLGKKVVWDLCDPIWWWNEPEWIQEMLDLASAVVVSCEGLANDFERAFKVRPTVIQDRMPFEKKYKVHRTHFMPTPVPVMVWFGYAMNRGPSLGGFGLAMSRLMYERVPYRFRLIDNCPQIEPWQEERLWSDKIECVEWKLDTFHDELCKCDIAILPPFPGPWGAMKSSNKQATAFWAGLPVHDGQDYYSLKTLLLDPGARAYEGEKNRALAEAEFDVQQSVAEWQTLLQGLP